MKIKKLFFSVVVSVAIGGCTVLDTAIGGDSLSTYIGISSNPNIVEANPVLKALSGNDAVSVAVVSAALSYGAVYGVRYYAPGQCKPFYHALSAIKLGAAVNNLAVLAGATANVPLVAALAVGTLGYQLDVTRRGADKFCSHAR
ncbi:MAG TPA: hypothetical protein PLE99_05655 [Candidatus Thiothrix moscowensis]|uniref:hypothetical protein n=1 Tax=unclassified Thiothrix TaxID=2636184 RepID=UPI0025E376AD|nr:MULTISPECIES: hypothetical protein [unclassified Thiothrix]HRJ52229.1 hypothetical protein [Candidatus Thiothrix moscowensis]HRJ92544.1 hypothetical protein [Candidatus Thiothrix moscowensis]